MNYENLKIIFRTKSQIMLVFCLAVFFFFLTTALGNFSSLIEFFNSSSSVGNLLYFQILLSLLFTSLGNPLSIILTVFLSFLLAINIILVIKSKRRTHLKSQPLGLLGILSGALGIGCAACGTLLSEVLISYFGIAFVTTTLPFQSLFFQFTGIILLILSIILLLKNSNTTKTCEITKN